MAVVDDPTAKQRTLQGKAGAYAGAKKYGEAANLPISAMKKKSVSSVLKRAAAAVPLLPRPVLHGGRDERSSLLEGRGEGHPTGGASGSKVHKPHLDEMHGPKSLPYRPNRATPRKPDSGSKIFQPTRLAAIRTRVRPRPALKRRRTGAPRWVEEAVRENDGRT